MPQVTVYVVVDVGETDTEPDVWLPVEKLVPVHEVAFVDDHVRVADCPEVIEVGEAERVADGVLAAAETTTAVQAPQLLPSFDSAMVPAEAAEFLSAHVRTYHVAADGKVYESVAVVFAPAASAAALCVPMSVALVPDASVAL